MAATHPRAADAGVVHAGGRSMRVTLRLLLDDGQLLEVDGPISVRRHPIGVPLVDLTGR